MSFKFQSRLEFVTASRKFAASKAALKRIVGRLLTCIIRPCKVGHLSPSGNTWRQAINLISNTSTANSWSEIWGNAS